MGHCPRAEDGFRGITSTQLYFRLGAARAIARALLTSVDKLNKTNGFNLPETKIDEVYQEYRKLKHALRALRNGRNVSLQQAGDAFFELVEILEKRKMQLTDPTTKFPAWKDTH